MQGCKCRNKTFQEYYQVIKLKLDIGQWQNKNDFFSWY